MKYKYSESTYKTINAFLENSFLWVFEAFSKYQTPNYIFFLLEQTTCKYSQNEDLINLLLINDLQFHVFPCQQLLFSETKKKWEVKICANNTETTATYSKLQHQGNSGCMLDIKYSKLTLVTRFKKKRAQRKRKTIPKCTSWSNQNLNTIDCRMYEITIPSWVQSVFQFHETLCRSSD